MPAVHMARKKCRVESQERNWKGMSSVYMLEDQQKGSSYVGDIHSQSLLHDTLPNAANLTYNMCFYSPNTLSGRHRLSSSILIPWPLYTTTGYIVLCYLNCVNSRNNIPVTMSTPDGVISLTS